MKERLKHSLQEALQTCYRQGVLHSVEFPEPVLEVPARADHGDFASNIAMLLARAEKKNPRQIAEVIIAALGDGGGLWRRLEVAGPGFINFFLTNRCWYGVLDDVVRQGDAYGRSHFGGGKKIQVEFVSANPTGPLHIGHGRGAAIGDAVASILDAAGYQVQREYYINDAGNQVSLLGRSIWMRMRELRGEAIDFPADGYQGDYIRDIARDLLAERGEEVASLPEEQAVAFCCDYGIDAMRAGIDRDLQEFGVRFDNWYSERSV